MQYNLVRNGVLRALTSSGTGNKSLTWSELESLTDGVTTSGGVSVTNTDTLYIEADLSQRIKLDSVRLYSSDLTKLSNINFYYKNNENDGYTLMSKNVGSYYYPTLVSPGAPRFVLATISGVNMNLYEYMLVNDDYIVAYGADGSLGAVYLDNTPIGTEGSPQAVYLYNNQTLGMPADAYTVIDYTGTDGDNYVKISETENGTYYGITDGSIVEDDQINSEIRWSMGLFVDTEISADSVILTSPSTSGTYTTPIFGLDNQYNSSYFLIDGTATSGTGSISYDPDVYNGSIRVRSSDEEPLPSDEGYTHYHSGSTMYINKWIPETNSFSTLVSFNSGDTDRLPVAIACDRRTGYIAISHTDNSARYDYFRIYNRNGYLVNSIDFSGSDFQYFFSTNMQFDKYGGLWGYGSFPSTPFNSRRLTHLNSSFSVLYQLDEGGLDFIHDLAVELDGNGVWYTDKINDEVIHRSTNGTLLNTIVLNTPRAICGTLDNGCWVVDDNDGIARRYDSDGNLVKSVQLPDTPAYGDSTPDRLAHDYDNGFWYRDGNYIYHVTSDGTVDVSDVFINSLDDIRASKNGCYIVDYSGGYIIKYLDRESGSITKQHGVSVTGYTRMVGVFYMDVSSSKEFQDTNNVLPVSYDPVWGTGGSLSWSEVRKDGYFLPKVKYHQVEVTLRGDATLEKIIMPPAIRTQDIQPEQSKSVYIKTVIPTDADITDYETRIKSWWGVEE